MDAFKSTRSGAHDVEQSTPAPSESNAVENIEDLIEKARGGDTAAFASLVERFQWYVLEIARRYAPAEAEDVAQRVWIEVFRALERYDSTLATFSRWVRVIATRKAITAATARRRREALTRIFLTQSGRNEGYIMEQSLGMQIQEIAAVAREGAARLSDRKRRVFELVCGSGLRRAEVARQLGMTDKAVRRTLCEARREILTYMRKKGVL